MSKQYETVVGLKVRAELTTKTGIFCDCSTRFEGALSTRICPVYTGMPDSLLALDKQVVEYVLAIGLAANCRINQYCKFDKKNYFHPDNPQNYQISRLYLPVCRDDWVDIETESDLKKRVGIHGIYMKEDAGKLIRDEWEDYSLVDYNRSGVPLIEIVPEPDMRSAEEVTAYLEKLRPAIQYLDAPDCKLQEGSMRTDMNLSVREAGAPKFGTRTEMENLNPFKVVVRATEGERRHQIGLLEEGRQVIQGTRRWDDNKEGSKTIRSKEDARDYRYFPDPGLVPVIISDEWIARVKARQPGLRTEKTARYKEEYGPPEYDARLLTSSRHMADIFEETVRLSGRPKEASNWLMVEATRSVKERGMRSEDMEFSPSYLAVPIRMVGNDITNRTVAKIMLEKVFRYNADPEAYVGESGLKMVKDEGALWDIVKVVMAANPQSVEDYRDGREKIMGFLMSQITKAVRGKTDPSMMNQLVRELFASGDA